MPMHSKAAIKAEKAFFIIEEISKNEADLKERKRPFILYAEGKNGPKSGHVPDEQNRFYTWQ